jgi:hypothetical protein
MPSQIPLAKSQSGTDFLNFLGIHFPLGYSSDIRCQYMVPLCFGCHFHCPSRGANPVKALRVSGWVCFCEFKQIGTNI